MTHPRHTLEQIAATARNLLEQWPRYETTSALLANSTVPGTTGAGAHGGDTPDPVYANHLSHAAWDETAAELAEALGHMRSIEKRITGIVIQDPSTAREVDAAGRAARCAVRVCTELGVDFGNDERPGTGLCWRHLQEHRRAARGGAA